MTTVTEADGQADQVGSDQLDVGPTANALQRVAARLGCTEGQVYTMVIGAVLACGLALLGGPATLPTDPLAASPSAPAPVTAPDAGVDPPEVVVPSASQPVFGPPAPQSLPPAPAAPVPDPVTTPSGPSPAPAPAPQPGTVTTFARVGAPGAPSGITVTPTGEVVVTTNNGTERGVAGPSVVLVYGPDGRLRRTVPVTGQPTRHADGLVAAAADRSGSAFVLDASTRRLLRLAPGATSLTVRATVPDVPLCLLSPGSPDCEQGLQNRAPSLAGLAADARGILYITDAGQGIVWRLRPQDAAPRVWYAATDLATGDGPSGIHVDSQSRVLFTAGSTLDVANPGGGALYRLAVGPDGAPAERALVRAFGSADRPGALAVGRSGAGYLVLRGPGAVVSLDRDGEETGRITPSDGGAVRLDTPSGLALTAGRLLVTNQGTTDRRAWAVLSVAVNDAP